ncbi:MAG TPA: FecR domain-containing protein [Polyangiaceae bacterium]
MTSLERLFRRVADEQDALRARSRLGDRLAQRFAAPSKKRAPARRAFALAFAAAFVTAGVALAVLVPNSALRVRVGTSAETALVGAWLGAPDSKPLPLEFSDGSRFELEPRAKARLVELGRNGARVELGSGKLRVHVLPQRSTDYTLVAGPFAVHVTGTRFELGYAPESDSFELYLEEGQVEIQGCAFGKGRLLAAGQSVRASCKTPVVDVRYGRPRPEETAKPAEPSEAAPAAPLPPPAAPAAAAPIAAAPAAPAAATPERAPVPSAATSAAPSWRALAASGAHREAFAAVSELGFEAECARANAETLGTLADVARLAGAPRRAEHALVTLRERFPGTADAALAAFTLGRLEFDGYRSYRKAAGWFETYLRERPAGSMAREALGRLLEARYRAKDLAGARDVAARYLREYPSGPHAELASRVASSP